MAPETIAELLETIECLPEPDRGWARERVAGAMELAAPACRATLGLLALDLAAPVADAEATRRLSA